MCQSKLLHNVCRRDIDPKLDVWSPTGLGGETDSAVMCCCFITFASNSTKLPARICLHVLSTLRPQIDRKLHSSTLPFIRCSQNCAGIAWELMGLINIRSKQRQIVMMHRFSNDQAQWPGNYKGILNYNHHFCIKMNSVISPESNDSLH